MSGNTLDLTAAAAALMPVSAAYAPTIDGSLGVNSANHHWVFGSNGSTLTLPLTATAVTHQFLNSYTQGTGVFTLAQPAFSDLSGTATVPEGGTEKPQAHRSWGFTHERGTRQSLRLRQALVLISFSRGRRERRLRGAPNISTAAITGNLLVNEPELRDQRLGNNLLARRRHLGDTGGRRGHRNDNGISCQREPDQVFRNNLRHEW